MPQNVIAGLVPAISLRRVQCVPNRDGRDKSGHDGWDKPGHDG